ncbi:MAG: DNA-directed RNA polymerase subunit omega [Syntrophomonadaceae bacterium]|nr:DNA-directed RNA polymerase subunit omega [Syntrophomonadaceae bacterium]MDD3888329.1 DNA-directed RNA polymerase subunit omega [Syntrophomonadaceae bacterium]MDD4548836.1 DNA-directed RNA polymerase subunit omega [Syntrophomonadaceae bacterium]
MIPPSTKELISIGKSKYAVVVGVSRRVRVLSELMKDDEDFSLSAIITKALDEFTSGTIKLNKDGKS